MVKVILRADRIYSVLARKNKSQNWLAWRMKISGGYMSQLMHGVRRPSPRMRERIMKALPDSTFEELFEIANEGSSAQGSAIEGSETNAQKRS